MSRPQLQEPPSDAQFSSAPNSRYAPETSWKRPDRSNGKLSRPRVSRRRGGTLTRRLPFSSPTLVFLTECLSQTSQSGLEIHDTSHPSLYQDLVLAAIGSIVAYGPWRPTTVRLGERVSELNPKLPFGSSFASAVVDPVF
ncbi:hypothetical protein CSOJ01_06793 [Colletotrichum sojae]|uniref:Uncharacterized protein n=1 Tax=Colletotrichum sojae TaxID=2175907 RepID=A0A8H6JBH6_9PEZI|nr:hypothetical protein CSOJ01_06793 [Colletotrichum sojae]